MFVGERPACGCVSSRERGGPASRSRDPRQERAQANQVVRRRGKGHDRIDEFAAPMSQLSQSTYRIHPAEDLLDQTSLLLADRIPGITAGTAFDHRAARL